MRPKRAGERTVVTVASFRGTYEIVAAPTDPDR